MLRYKTETRPGLVALYDIRPGNGTGPFLQPWSPHGACKILYTKMWFCEDVFFFKYKTFNTLFRCQTFLTTTFAGTWKFLTDKCSTMDCSSVNYPESSLQPHRVCIVNISKYVGGFLILPHS